MSDLLAIDNLAAGWGAAKVLSGVSFTLGEGQSLALLGRNGMGKTTLLCALLGLATHGGGTIAFAGRDITRLAPERRAQAGLGWVPQERNIFRSLTVEENRSAVALPGPWSVARVWELFPRLRERRRNMGNQLSGGEQQMLAIGRALVLNPSLLLLDEPLEGLAPLIVEELLAVLRRIISTGEMAVIIVEQNAKKILPETSRAIILERGAVAHSGPSAELARDAPTLDRLLGIAR